MTNQKTKSARRKARSAPPHGSANTPLRAEVKDGKLIVEIGIETLEWASRPENGGTLERCKVDGRRRREWAEDVVREMEHENEVGESPLMRFLDEMMEKAADNGSGALCWPNGAGCAVSGGEAPAHPLEPAGSLAAGDPQKTTKE